MSADFAKPGMFDQSQQVERTERSLPLVQRAKNKDWEGPVIDYKDIDIIRRFLTTSHKLMSRKRSGTTAQQQKAIKIAVKRARYLALVPYSGV